METATRARKVCDIEMKIVAFVINGRVKLTVPLDRQQ